MHTLYGIWLDHAHAYVIKSNKLGDMTFEKFESTVESHHKDGVMGDERLSLTDQKTHLEHRKHQFADFAKALFDAVSEADELVIFGPGTAKNELKHVLEEDHKILAAKLSGVETSDKLSEPEMKDFMMKYFHLPRS